MEEKTFTKRNSVALHIIHLCIQKLHCEVFLLSQIIYFISL